MFKRVAKLIAVLVVVSTLMMMVAPAFAAGPIPPKDGKQYVVGMAIVGLQHPFFTEMKKHLEAEAQRQNVKLIVVDATDDVGKQMSQIEDLIQQNVDLLLVTPIDASALVAGIEKANAANIPVVVVDRRAAGGKYISFASTDNVQVGRNAGNYVATRLGGKGNVVEIEGQHGAGPTLDRGAGFHEVIDQYPGIKVIFKQPGEFQRAKGMEVMENVIQSGQQFDAVFCHNDEMAGGAREALKAHNLTGKVILVGVDAQADALQAIKDGTQDATNMYPPQSGKEGLIQGMHYLKGEPVQDTVWLPSALITKGNIDAYMNITY
jgi:ribose transport system substrate-binding protein